MSMATATEIQSTSDQAALAFETLVLESRVAATAALCVAFLNCHRGEWDTPPRRRRSRARSAQ